MGNSCRLPCFSEKHSNSSVKVGGAQTERYLEVTDNSHCRSLSLLRSTPLGGNAKNERKDGESKGISLSFHFSPVNYFQVIPATLLHNFTNAYFRLRRTASPQHLNTTLSVLFIWKTFFFLFLLPVMEVGFGM